MKIKIIAHRGNYNNHCENKINCLIKTINDKNIDGIEIDVRMTRDKIFVLHHNSLIMKNKKIFKIENSYYHNLYIDTLEELLSKVNNKIIMIDMKCLNNEKIYVKNIIKIIKKHSNLNIIVTSFNDKLVTIFKKKYPTIPCGLIIGYYLNLNKNFKLYNFISIHYSLINKYQFPYYVWGKNNIPYSKYCIGIIVN